MGNEEEIQRRYHKAVLERNLYVPDLSKFDEIREKLIDLQRLIP